MDKKILVDWLTFTVGMDCFLELDEDGCTALEAMKFSERSIESHIRQLLGITDSKIKFLPRHGKYGYEKCLFCVGISVCWGGYCNDTFMFDFSGKGCRLLETLAPSLEWLTFIQTVSAYQRHNFSRLDIACDTFGDLKISNIIRYALHGRYISRWKSLPRVVQGREETVDFGSPQSLTMLRIYNKTLERECKVDDGIEVPAGWVRCELQFRNDAVDSFLREWLALGDISAVYLGIMANQLRFVKKRLVHQEQCETVAWWRDFLDNSKPIKLAYKGGLAYNLQSLERYLFGQAASSIKTWLMLSDWDVNKMLEMVAFRKTNDRQGALVHTMSAVNGESLEQDEDNFLAHARQIVKDD